MCVYSSAEGKIRLSFWRFSEKSVKVSYNKKLSQSFIKAKYCISSVEGRRGGDKAPRVGKKRRNSDSVGVRFLPQSAALTLLGSNLGKLLGRVARVHLSVCQSQDEGFMCNIWHVL